MGSKELDKQFIKIVIFKIFFYIELSYPELIIKKEIFKITPKFDSS